MLARPPLQDQPTPGVPHDRGRPSPPSPPLSAMQRARRPSTRRPRTRGSCPSCSAAGSTRQGYADYLLGSGRSTPPSRQSDARSADDPLVAAVPTRRWSVSPLDADLDHWGRRVPAPAGRLAPPPTPTRQRHLEATTERPALFVAHHYTRYLGDLSGGQAIGRILHASSARRRRRLVLRLPRDPEAQALQGRLPRPLDASRLGDERQGPRRGRGRRLRPQPGGCSRSWRRRRSTSAHR